jgi:Fe-S cluster assembly iron-binding protein IscA
MPGAEPKLPGRLRGKWMLTVTESAKKLLWEMLMANNTEPDTGVRLTIESNGRWSLVLDKEGYEDDFVEYEGEKVLLVAPEVASMINDVTIDTKDTPNGPKLFVSRM